MKISGGIFKAKYVYHTPLGPDLDFYECFREKISSFCTWDLKKFNTKLGLFRFIFAKKNNPKYIL